MTREEAKRQLDEILLRVNNAVRQAQGFKADGRCDNIKSVIANANGDILSSFQTLVSNIQANSAKINDSSILIEARRQLNEFTTIKLPLLNELFSTCEQKTVVPDGSNPQPADPATTPTNPSGPNPPTTVSVNAARQAAIATPSARDSWVEGQSGDWRVRLSLAPDAGPILYRAPMEELQESILFPLSETDGVIFPYTPSINTTYTAAYEPTILTHSNYKVFNYTGSYIEAVNITCDFTAQDTFEANYLLAVIHFFRSVTKMFYGQDQNVAPGTPPPLCFLTGLGEFQFNMHPLVISTFTYSLPNNVNYVRSSNQSSGPPGANRARARSRDNASDVSNNRLRSTGSRINTGGVPMRTIWPNNLDGRPGTSPTYVPTAMSIQLTAYPVISRNKVSNQFSLQDYATGKLLQGSRNSGGAFW